MEKSLESPACSRDAQNNFSLKPHAGHLVLLCSCEIWVISEKTILKLNDFPTFCLKSTRNKW